MPAAGVDSSIPLQANAPQIDLASIYSAGLQLKQMQQQMQTQNSLKAILQNPDALDKTGAPTANTLAQIARLGPQGLEISSKLADQASLAEQRKAATAHDNSETQAAERKQAQEALTDGLGAYDAEMASGSVAPDIAEKNLKGSLRDFVMSQPWSDEKKASNWAALDGLSPAQLRKASLQLSMSDEARQQQEKPQLVVGADGKPETATVDPATGGFVVKDAQGNVVDGPIEKPGTAMDPERVREDKERLAHDEVRLQQGDERLKQGQQHVNIDLQRAAEGSKPNLTPAAIDQIADQVHAGDPAALRNIGRGSQGAADLAAIRNRLAEKFPDSSGTDLANIDAEYKGQQAGEAYLGRRGAQLSQAGAALDTLITQSHEAYAKLPRGQFVPYNKLTEAVRKGTSSPEEYAAFTADQAVINQWAKAINPTGALTVEATRKGSEMLSQATSQEAHDAVLNQMRQEIAAERGSIPGARSDIRRDPAGPPPAPITATGPGGRKIVLQNGKWVDAKTGAAL